MNRKDRKKMINNTLENNGAYGLIDIGGLKKLNFPLVVSFTCSTKDMSITKTFPIVKEDLDPGRISQIGVYGIRQVLGASLLRKYEWNKDNWLLGMVDCNMKKVQRQRDVFSKTLFWKLIKFVDKVRDWLVDKIVWVFK